MTHLLTRHSIAIAFALAAGCVTGGVPEEDGGPDAPDAGAEDAAPPPRDAGPPPECEADSTLGLTCARDSECDDHCFCNGRELCTAGTCVAGAGSCEAPACATSSCDEVAGACSFAGDDSLCDDADPCNGLERCDTGLGCRAGAPPTCNDADICTIDYCEPGVGCVYEPFDGDGDGESARSCGGNDCNDRDPAIVPGAEETCDNATDDNCNGLIDIEEDTCRPANDTCATAEDITPAGLGTFRYRRATLGFTSDATLTCTGSSSDTRRSAPDAVFVLRLDEMRDVTLRVEGLAYNAGIILRERSACESGPDLKCAAPSTSTMEPIVHRRRLAPGEYAIFVKTRTENVFTLAVTIEAASAAQADICVEDTLDISAGGTFTGALEDDDYDVPCRTSTSAYPEAAHRLVVPVGEFRDIRLAASTRSPSGSSSTPYVAITTDCSSTTAAFSECDGGSTSAPAELSLRGVPEGTYYVLVENTASNGIGAYTLTAEITASAGREPGDSCALGVPVVVSEAAPGTIDLGPLDSTRDTGEFCGANRAGYRDAFFTFTLESERDVLVRTTSSARHWVGVSMTCGTVASPLDCMASSGGVAERRFLRVPAGAHFLGISTLADTGTITAQLETFPPTPRPANDECAGAATIVDGTPTDVDLPQYSDDESFSCGAATSLDAYYTFTLASQRFVTLRAEGARSMALLRDACGTTPAFCVTGGPPQITQILDAGTYYAVVETPALEAMPVRLRFTTADP